MVHLSLLLVSKGAGTVSRGPIQAITSKWSSSTGADPSTDASSVAFPKRECRVVNNSHRRQSINRSWRGSGSFSGVVPELWPLYDQTWEPQHHHLSHSRRDPFFVVSSNNTSVHNASHTQAKDTEISQHVAQTAAAAHSSSSIGAQTDTRDTSRLTLTCKSPIDSVAHSSFDSVRVALRQPIHILIQNRSVLWE